MSSSTHEEFFVFQERLKSKQLDLPRAVRDSMFQFRKQAFSISRLAHELTHLQISIQEGSGTRDPHEDRDQWKFQENNRHTPGGRGKGHIRQATDEHQNHGQKECNLATH